MLRVAMPKVAVIAGPNGAGKSTTAPAVLQNALEVLEFVNADTIAAGLSAFFPENVAIAAGRLMLNRVRELAREHRDFAFETTLASRSFAPWLRELQSDGYTFHLVYLWLPTVELAVARVAERVRRGGHAVPENTVRRRYTRSLTNFFALYSQFADSWVMLGNSSPRGPHLVAKRSIGRPVRILDADGWNALRATYEQEASTKAELEAAAIANEKLIDRIVEEAGRAVEEAIRDHKRAGNPIAEWRDGRVVLVPPDQIED